MTIRWFVKCFLSEGMSTIRHFVVLFCRLSLMLLDCRLKLRFMTTNMKGRNENHLGPTSRIRSSTLQGAKDDGRRGRVGSFSAKKNVVGWERMIFVCCVSCCVCCLKKGCRFSRSLLGLSRDLSHLQQRTRHFVHFSSVTWPRNFHHCIVSESLYTNFTNFFTVNVPFTFILIFLFLMHKSTFPLFSGIFF